MSQCRKLSRLVSHLQRDQFVTSAYLTTAGSAANGGVIVARLREVAVANRRETIGRLERVAVSRTVLLGLCSAPPAIR
jgi:hypothetical protein